MEKSNIKEMSSFKLNDGSSKTDSKNSDKSQTSNNSLNEIKPFKLSLKTIESLQKENKNILTNEIPYDLDEETNFSYITKILEDKNLSTKEKIHSFNNIIYKLSFNDRKKLLKNKKVNNLIKKSRKIIQQKKLKKVFISLLKSIMKENAKTINKLFQTKYYVPIQSSKIPFLQGSEEFIFANLINDTYDTFIVKSNFPKKSKDKSFDEKKYLSNYINEQTLKPIIKPIGVIENNNKFFEFDQKEYAAKKSETKIKIKKKINHYKYTQKKMLLKSILKKYCSKEFQNKHEQYLLEHPELQKNKRVKYIYEIIIESLYYYCLNFNEEKKMNLIAEFARIFYESENDKKECLNYGKKGDILKNESEENSIENDDEENMEEDVEDNMKEDDDEENIKSDDETENMEIIDDDEDNQQKTILIRVLDTDGKDFDFTKELKNKDYKVIIENNEFIINFYDYNVNYLLIGLANLNLDDVPKDEKKQKIENLLNEPQYWTVQRHCRENSPYNNKDLDFLFKKEIDIMLKNKVLENVFDEITFCQNYKYPYLDEGFLRQVQDSIIYMKFPTKLILGLTIKHMGIIIINKDRYHNIINEQKSKNIKFVLKLSEYSFYKATLIHEINFHYILVILFSNQKLNALYTPKLVFKNYKIDDQLKLDFGDKGEAILFGKKLSELYIKGIMNIINLDLWNKNENAKPIEIGKKFLALNKETEKDEIKIKELINLSEFTKKMYDIINDEKIEEPFDLEKNIGDFFSRGKVIDLNEDEFCINSKNFATIFPRGECLNVYRYYE